MTETSTYEKQAQDFLEKTGTTFKAEYIEHDFYFDDDKCARDIYRITLRRNRKSFSFRFGQSIDHSEKSIEPSAYDVLACLTKYEPAVFEEFCNEYGYDMDSRKAFKIYRAVTREYKGVMRLFSDVMEQLEGIQ